MILKRRKMLAKLMILEGLSQRELASAAGWSSHSYLGRLLRGEAVGVAEEPARLIAERLGVRVSDLFAPSPDNTSS
jgi:transcriptional regulator with XRE-family HTH domain